MQAASGPKTVEGKAGEMRRRIEHHVERIGSGLSDELAGAGPVEQRRPAVTNVKCPRAGNSDDAIQHDHGQNAQLYEVCKAAAKAI